VTASEVALCLAAVVSSSASQLCMKAASIAALPVRRLVLIAVGIACQLGAVVIAVLVLRTLTLSQLVAFAALAYILVPLGGRFAFGEQLSVQFWLGAGLIIGGVLTAVP
jgi:undecaprenyl phosphate-alpha-L-ara4N flippase subunit ArnE